MIATILWPLVAAACTLALWDCFRRWMQRETTTVRTLQAELKATQEDWSKRFTIYEKAHDMLVQRFNAAAPSPNPLGKSYSTRSAG